MELPPPAPYEIALNWHQVAEQPLPQLLEYVVQSAWQVDFDLERDAPFALNVFESPGRTILQIVTSHVAEDARASYEISRDLAQFYGDDGEGASPDAVAPPQSDMDAALLYGMGAVSAAEKLRAWWYALRDMVQRDAVMPLAPSRDGKRRGFAMDELEPELFERLRAMAKSQGVTIHSLMLLAMCRVIERHFKYRGAPRHIRLIDMFSLRGFAGKRAESLYENLVIPYPLRIRRGSDEAMLAQIRQRVGAMKAGDYRTEWFRCAIGARIFDWIGRLEALRAMVCRATQATVLITNPGRIPYSFTHFGAIEVEDFFTHAQLFPPGAAMCQFSGLGDKLRLLFVYDIAAFSESGLSFQSSLRQPFLQELRRLAGDVGTKSTYGTAIQSNAPEISTYER
jgi:NRPS condensation-like uncharacterized protein